MSDVRDLGQIEGHEVPGAGAGAAPPAPPAPAPPAPVQRSPAPAPADRPAVPELGRRALGAAREGTSQALRDVREAHRRGPKPNTRPLPPWVRRLAWVLDDAVAVPGTNGRRVGVDGFISLVPGFGDAAGLALSMIVVVAGIGAGVSFPTLLRMLLNVGFESIVGVVPFAGALFDMAYKANDRNVRLIEADLADRTATRRSSLAVLALTVFALVAAVLMFVGVIVAGVALLIWIGGRLL